MLILIRGAGDLATGIACRLIRSGFSVVLTDVAQPTTIRCTVAFSSVVYNKETMVEGITAKLAEDAEEAVSITREGKAAVLIDPGCQSVSALKPYVLVDAILAKKNLGTKLDDAPVVIGVGPGFTVGVDCHAAIETQRGHDLGRVLYEGTPEPNTGVPGKIGAFTSERLIRSPGDGIFSPVSAIGDTVDAGQVVAYVGDLPVAAAINGTLRGLLPAGTPVHKGMKSGDVDPRCRREFCYSVSDKALAIGGGVLEAICNLSGLLSDSSDCK